MKYHSSHIWFVGTVYSATENVYEVLHGVVGGVSMWSELEIDLQRWLCGVEGERWSSGCVVAYIYIPTAASSLASTYHSPCPGVRLHSLTIIIKPNPQQGSGGIRLITAISSMAFGMLRLSSSWGFLQVFFSYKQT